MSSDIDDSPPIILKAFLVILFILVLVIGHFVGRVRGVGVDDKNIEQDCLPVIQKNSLRPMSPIFYFELAVLASMVQKDAIREEIVGAMIVCESGGNDSALNPCDKDKTPSFGRLQFKPETLKRYVLKYEFFSQEEVDAWTWDDLMEHVWDGELQERIFRKMLDDSDVNFAWEFPDCYRRHWQLFQNYWRFN